MNLNEFIETTSNEDINEVISEFKDESLIDESNLLEQNKKSINKSKKKLNLILYGILIIGFIIIVLLIDFNSKETPLIIDDEIFNSTVTNVCINLNDTEEMIRNLGYIIDGSKVYNGDELVASIVMTDNTVSTVIKYSASKDIFGNIITNKLEDYEGNGDKKSYVAIKNNESVNVTDFYYQESEITNIVRYENGIFKEYCEIRNY